ncbi:MAG: hypothetical protein ACE5JQ_05005 [Candidatus Methylomirabilales bacterium]
MEGESIGRPGSTEIIPWSSSELPPLDALILPEDTYLLLQAVTEDVDPDVTPLDLWVALEHAARTEKHPLGSVMIGDGTARGVRYVARVIVYDFEAEMICRKEAVLAGLQSALSALVQRGCKTVGVFPLGTTRGGISQAEYLDAIDEITTRPGEEFPRTLYLLGKEPEAGEDADP